MLCYGPSSFLLKQQKIPAVLSYFINLSEQSVKYQLLGMSLFLGWSVSETCRESIIFVLEKMCLPTEEAVEKYAKKLSYQFSGVRVFICSHYTESRVANISQNFAIVDKLSL